MCAPQVGILGRHGTGFCHLPEKGFHLSGRQERDQDPAALSAGIRPDVRNFAGTEDGTAGCQSKLILADFHDEFTLYNVEPFILFVMQVSCRTTFLVKGVFNDEDTPAVPGHDFKGNGADSQSPLFPEPVLVSSDQKRFGTVLQILRRIHKSSPRL
jgi:hypothetical protein